MLSRNAPRLLLVLTLFVAAGSGGSAHQPSLNGADSITRSVERLVARRGAPPAGLLRGLRQQARQSETGAPGQRVVTRALQRLFQKANGSERWQPIDNRPEEESPADEDEDGFEDPDNAGPAGTQSELSIAVDATGQHIVVGMNDFRGFSNNPLSASGFAYSDNGGATFTDGGQLPVTVPTSTLGGQTFPQVFGDPEVKYLGGSTFVYFSIVVSRYGANGLVQTMGVHRSTDFGHTWTGPFEITPATNPGGLVDVNGDAVDAADKELADVDPDTGRVLMSWSNFTATSVEMSAAYSDNLATATPPTWAPRRVVASAAADGQAAIPRFAGNGSPNAYIAWQRFPGPYLSRIGFSRSTDNGVTWSAPVDVTGSFIETDQVLGNDRVNNFPTLAVDTSPGPNRGTVYMVYPSNNSFDGADLSFRRSTDGGLTFSPAVSLNSRPGGDRAQWFPNVTVDRQTGRIYVSYYDQGVAPSGDLTETTYQYSDDGGVTWHKPMPVTDRPFHAGYGNDSNQPNLGDYNQAVAQNGELFVVWAGNPSLVSFTDGQPATSMTVPDVMFKRSPAVRAGLRLGNVSWTDSGGNGFIDAGEDVHLSLPLTNYATNPLFASIISNINGALSSTTPGVSVLQAGSSYANAAPGATTANTTDYVIRLSSGLSPGSRIEIALTVSSSEGNTVLLYTLPTGTPKATVLLSQNFDAVAPGTLPAGWAPSHGGGSNTVPWTTSATFNAGNNGAFHANANDATMPTRWERLFSPTFDVPSSADYVLVEFDVKYDTENDPNLPVLAYDGFFLRVTDVTPGRTLRSVLAEAFAEEFTTGALQHYPRHLPRFSNPAYFEDMSAWAGDSGGLRHVRMKLPGMAGSRAQLRFEFTQDSNSTCADVRPGHTCGVLVDNVVVSSVVAAQADLSIAKFGPATVLSGHDVTYMLVATNNSTDPARSTANQVTVTDTLPAGTTFVSSSAPAGWTCQTSGQTVSCTTPAMAPAATAAFTITANVPCGTPDGTSLTNQATIAAATPVDPNPANNGASATSTVSNPPPVISDVSATPSVLRPPNHKMVDVTVNYTVSDNCGTVTSALSVSSNEPSGGSPDWIVLDAHHVQLRAERDGGGSDRVYTITITATNDQGGVSTATTTVVVAHDDGNN